MITMMAPVCLLSRRDASEREYHLLPERRVTSENASDALKGSSTIRMLPPRPVNVPSTEVANRNPPCFVCSSFSVLLLSETFLKILRYSFDSISRRVSEECLFARSCE